ncbi:MAG TPA: bL35 family ribosomal protein [Candidatus Gracilibacteria bacterium]|nr:bL35 family ribosomal protein [Candidatus Gracilibacteria bacterium]
MKLRSRSSAKKRIKITGTGKIRFQKSAKQHLLINKSKRQKNVHKYGKATTPGNEANMRKVLPYSSK